MTGRSTVDSVAITAGLLGSTVITVASLVTAVAYTGVQGEPYSFLNHFVSELGELGVSELARVFNLGLNIGGIAFIVFIVGVVLARPGRLRIAYGITGALAGIGGFCVGVFPMNDLGVHGLSALTFFVFGLATVLLASADFWRSPDPRFPRGLAVIGVADALAFAIFLGLLAVQGSGLAHPTDRAAVWPLTIFEWLSLAGILLWTFLTAASWWRATAGEPTPAPTVSIQR